MVFSISEVRLSRGGCAAGAALTLWHALQVAEKRRVLRLGGGFAGGEVRATQLPDDVLLLQGLQQRGVLVGTPPQDYDDAYTIR